MVKNSAIKAFCVSASFAAKCAASRSFCTIGSGTSAGTNKPAHCAYTIGTPSVVNGVSSTTATLTVDLASGSSAFGGVLADGSLGTLALAKTGAGTFVLTGANTFSGGSTVSVGTLQVGQGGVLGNASISSGALLSFNRPDSFTHAAYTTGLGSVTVLGGGNLTLTGSFTHDGGTNVAAGQIITLGNGGSIGGAGVLTVDGSLKVDNTGSASIGAVIGGLGSLSVDAGALVLTGAGDGVLATDFVNAASFAKSGAGVWTISTAQTYSIETSIEAGTLKAGAAGVLSANSTVRLADVVGSTSVRRPADSPTCSCSAAPATSWRSTSDTTSSTGGSAPTRASWCAKASTRAICRRATCRTRSIRRAPAVSIRAALARRPCARSTTRSFVR